MPLIKHHHHVVEGRITVPFELSCELAEHLLDFQRKHRDRGIRWACGVADDLAYCEAKQAEPVD